MFKRGIAKKITVQISRAGQDAESIDLKVGSTVSAALEEAGMNKKDTETIRVNKKNADMDTKLKEGDTVVLSKNIAGGAF